MKVIIARPKPIDREWRVFVVDGHVVTASRYRLNGHLALEYGAPSEVIAFVEARLHEWLPSPAFALDIAEHDGELTIMELSDIHSAGHYAADVDAIVAAMTQLAERWTARHCPAARNGQSTNRLRSVSSARLEILPWT